MSKIIDKILCREILKFIITQNDERRVRNTLKKIFASKGFEINLWGKFKNENEFILTDKITIGIYLQGGGNPAELKGRFSYESDKVILLLKTKSQFVFPVFSFIAPILLIPFTIIIDLESMEKIYSIVFILVFSVIANLIGNFLKNQLLNKSLRELGLIK